MLRSDSLRFTGLARTLDIRHPSNRLAVAATLGAAAATAVWRSSTGRDEVLRLSVVVGLAVFLGWALGRELDPDEPSAAGIAAGLAVVGLWVGEPSLAALFAGLVAVRIVVRTTGIPPTWLDGVALGAGAAYLGGRPATWAALLGLVLALAWDVALPGGAPLRNLWLAVVVIAAAIAGAVAADVVRPDWDTPRWFGWVVLVTGALGAVTTLHPPRPTARTDRTSDYVVLERLVAGRVLALGVGLASFAAAGASGIAALMPLWAALLATAGLGLRRRLEVAAHRPV